MKHLVVIIIVFFALAALDKVLLGGGHLLYIIGIMLACELGTFFTRLLTYGTDRGRPE